MMALLRTLRLSPRGILTLCMQRRFLSYSTFHDDRGGNRSVYAGSLYRYGWPWDDKPGGANFRLS